MPQKRVDNRLADFYSPSIALSGPLYAHTHTHTHSPFTSENSDESQPPRKGGACVPYWTILGFTLFPGSVEIVLVYINNTRKGLKAYLYFTKS